MYRILLDELKKGKSVDIPLEGHYTFILLLYEKKIISYKYACTIEQLCLSGRYSRVVLHMDKNGKVSIKTSWYDGLNKFEFSFK